MAFMTGLFDPYAGAGADQRYDPTNSGSRIRSRTPAEILAGLSPSTGMPSSEISLHGASSYGQEDVPSAVPPWQEILAQIMGGGGDAAQSQMLAMNLARSPYGPILRDLRRQMADSRAQTSQNQADINSWFGQLGGMYNTGARVARRSSRKAGKENARFNRGILSGVADPGVAYSLAAGAQSDARHISESGVAEANFNRNMAADSQRQAAYQNLVQSRLGAKERQDIRAQMGQVRAARAEAVAKAMSESSSDPMEGLFNFIQLLPEEARMEFLTQGTLSTPAPEGGFDTDARSGLAAALGAVRENLFTENPEDERPDIAVRDFNAMLDAMRHSAVAGGFDLQDPQVLQAFRSWIAGHILPQWNSIAAAREGRMQYQPKQGGFYQSGE